MPHELIQPFVPGCRSADAANRGTLTFNARAPAFRTKEGQGAVHPDHGPAGVLDNPATLTRLV